MTLDPGKSSLWYLCILGLSRLKLSPYLNSLYALYFVDIFDLMYLFFLFYLNRYFMLLQRKALTVLKFEKSLILLM